MRDALSQIPTSFKILWAAGAIFSLTATGVILWAIIKLVLKFTS